MPKAPEPVVLELATLTREQMGPYLLLGLDKSADKEEIDKHWADRVKWALRQPSQVKATREDVNQTILKEIDRRIRSDVSSLNTDTAEGVVGQLTNRYAVNNGKPGRAWQPLDNEKPLADYMPSAEIPDATAELPPPHAGNSGEIPFAATLLERLARQDLDPWAVELPPQDPTP